MTRLPMFPLGMVAFPGIQMPLHVFEPRYQSLMAHLLERPDDDRRFGIVAIKLGFEVGDRSVRALYGWGCEVSLERYEADPEDGTYDIEVEGRRRLRIDGTFEDEKYPTAEVTFVDEPVDDRSDEAADRAYAMFEAYRDRLSHQRGTEVLEGTMPTDPTRLSYALSASVPMALAEQQQLLETRGTTERLGRIAELLRREMQAMTAVPSLPATRITTTSWSPN